MTPNFDLEKSLLNRFIEKHGVKQPYIIFGVDEVGMGAIAGPIVVAGVSLNMESECAWYDDLRDSKELSKRKRKKLFESIIDSNDGYIHIAMKTNTEIDTLGIKFTHTQAMEDVIVGVRIDYPFHYLLGIFDGVNISKNLNKQFLTDYIFADRADSISRSVAAASIVAKVIRDETMSRFDGEYPGYGFKNNKGYPTPDHLEALQRLGPCDIHRSSFKPVQKVRRG